MADIHVLKGSTQGEYKLIFHFPVANTNNTAGVSFRTALVNSGLAVTQMKDGDGTGGTISAAEKANILAGIIYEHAVDFPVDSGGASGAQVLATVRAKYASENTQVTADIGKILKYFGYYTTAV